MKHGSADTFTSQSVLELMDPQTKPGRQKTSDRTRTEENFQFSDRTRAKNFKIFDRFGGPWIPARTYTPDESIRRTLVFNHGNFIAKNLKRTWNMNQKDQGQCVISGKSKIFENFEFFEEFFDRLRLAPKFIWGAEMVGFRIVKKYWRQVTQHHQGGF